MNPYETCPIFENERYLLRLIEPTDTKDLLPVYSDEKAVPFFNSDNCNGDNFHYSTLERMQTAVDFWLQSYTNGWFVRWAIIDKKSNFTRLPDSLREPESDSGNPQARNTAIGTIELFNRQAEDYFNNCALLRLDLRSDYERADHIYEILSLIIPQTCEMFGSQMAATKVPPFAAERKAAVEKLGFTLSEEVLVGGQDGKEYRDYYVLPR